MFFLCVCACVGWILVLKKKIDYKLSNLGIVLNFAKKVIMSLFKSIYAW